MNKVIRIISIAALCILAFIGALQVTNAIIGAFVWCHVDGECYGIEHLYGLGEYKNNALPITAIVESIQELINPPIPYDPNAWHICTTYNDPLPCDEIGYDTSNI